MWSGMMRNPATVPSRLSRREAIQSVGASTALAAAGAIGLADHANAEPISTKLERQTSGFWPGGARLAVSFSLMFEAGGQPISGAGGVIPDPIQQGLPDLPTNAFFQYGIDEGIPRLLDLFDKHRMKVSSFMIGQAVEKRPDLAREIVRRGHEAAAHGRTWENSYAMNADAERRFISDGVESIVKATGQHPVGWNAYWMRNFPFDGWNPAAYEQTLRDEFDQLYEEGGHRRRMMVVSLHDRISGHANRVRSLDRFLTYARSKPGVWFARKDEIARWALSSRGATPVVKRGPPTVTGLPGSVA